VNIVPASRSTSNKRQAGKESPWHLRFEGFQYRQSHLRQRSTSLKGGIMGRIGVIILWLTALIVTVIPASATERVVVGELITNTS